VGTVGFAGKVAVVFQGQGGTVYRLVVGPIGVHQYRQFGRVLACGLDLVAARASAAGNVHVDSPAQGYDIDAEIQVTVGKIHKNGRGNTHGYFGITAVIGGDHHRTGSAHFYRQRSGGTVHGDFIGFHLIAAGDPSGPAGHLGGPLRVARGARFLAVNAEINFDVPLGEAVTAACSHRRGQSAQEHATPCF
jgi:hypothetical protein